MIRAPSRAVVLAAALAGCGVKAAPRPPQRPGPEPLDPRAAASPAPGAPVAAAAAPGGAPCSCAPPDPFFAPTTTRP